LELNRKLFVAIHHRFARNNPTLVSALSEKIVFQGELTNFSVQYFQIYSKVLQKS
jgi:hypothetical protein